MKYDHLIRAIEDGAEEKLRDLRDSKDREVREIGERAEEDSGRVRLDLLDETKRRIEVETNKKIYSAREQAKNLITGARQEGYLQVFHEAELKLASFRGSPSYETFFNNILTESIESLENDRISLHIDKKDESLCQRLVKDKPGLYDIITDLKTHGGLNVSTPDGKVVIRNTVEDRLARAKERMKVVVFSGLYGDQDVR